MLQDASRRRGRIERYEEAGSRAGAELAETSGADDAWSRCSRVRSVAGSTNERRRASYSSRRLWLRTTTPKDCAIPTHRCRHNAMRRCWLERGPRRPPPGGCLGIPDIFCFDVDGELAAEPGSPALSPVWQYPQHSRRPAEPTSATALGERDVLGLNALRSSNVDK